MITLVLDVSFNGSHCSAPFTSTGNVVFWANSSTSSSECGKTVRALGIPISAHQGVETGFIRQSMRQIGAPAVQ